jgi:hypothetical protein
MNAPPEGDNHMFATVRALLEHIVDYAGLFPPAKLPLHEALRNYANYTSGSRHWLVGRFVCPAARLDELTAAAHSLRLDARVRVAVLGSSGADPDEFLARLGADVAALERFRQGWGRPDAAEVFEVALPPTAAQQADFLSRTLTMTTPAQLCTFFEIPPGPSWDDDIRTACAYLSGIEGAGLKVRCGGLTADAVPSDERLAEFMVRCRDARVAWKATAGLHHPLPHWDEQTGASMHGFLNVFTAAALSYVLILTTAQLVAVLRDRAGRDFWFQNDRFGWRHWQCSLADLQDIRQRWLPSFGSCSVDEPYADLVSMGLIEDDAQAKSPGP